MNPILQTQLEAAVQQFCGGEKAAGVLSYGNGHINDTYRIIMEDDGTAPAGTLILQRINTNIFTQPILLMENIAAVTNHLKQKILERGGNPMRETLSIISAQDGKPYYKDEAGDYWRCFPFISDTVSLDQAESASDFYESAVAFGTFQRLLADFPAQQLHETIPAFHDTKARFAVFQKAVADDICSRAAAVEREIAFVLEHEALAGAFGELLARQAVPLRVTHNDTKLNNVLLDKTTRKGICVIDLDTVMPGLAMNDFGDSIRFGASTAAEDERDLSKVSCDMKLFEVYTKGFIEGCGGRLTEQELALLPMGAKVMTFECGMRFLTDYLQGDTYFKTHRPGQNLDRCRTQFKLVADMEEKWDTMQRITERYMRS